MEGYFVFVTITEITFVNDIKLNEQMERQWKNLYRYPFQTSTRVLIKIDDSRSPKTVKGLLDSLPFEVKINNWGKELYTGKIPVKV